WLRRHFEILKPRVIVTLGRHAMYKFFATESISRIHGKIRKTADGLVVFPMYHPAAALHQPALRSALVADMAALALYLAAEPPAPKRPVEEEKPVVQTTLFSDCRAARDPGRRCGRDRQEHDGHRAGRRHDRRRRRTHVPRRGDA